MYVVRRTIWRNFLMECTSKVCEVLRLPTNAILDAGAWKDIGNNFEETARRALLQRPFCPSLQIYKVQRVRELESGASNNITPDDHLGSSIKGILLFYPKG